MTFRGSVAHFKHTHIQSYWHNVSKSDQTKHILLFLFFGITTDTRETKGKGGKGPLVLSQVDTIEWKHFAGIIYKKAWKRVHLFDFLKLFFQIEHVVQRMLFARSFQSTWHVLEEKSHSAKTNRSTPTGKHLPPSQMSTIFFNLQREILYQNKYREQTARCWNSEVF